MTWPEWLVTAACGAVVGWQAHALSTLRRIRRIRRRDPAASIHPEGSGDN